MLCLLCVACERDFSDSITVGYPIAERYTALDVSDAFEVVMCDTVSEAMVSVKGGEHRNLILKVEKGTLRVGFKSSLFNWYHGAARVLLPVNSELCDVELSGASTFHGNLRGDKVEVDLSGASDFYGNIQGREVSIDLSGSSDLSGEINADEIEMDLSGSSTVKGSGSCNGLIDMDISGSSEVNAYGLECRAAKVEVSGSSTVMISCCENIRGELSGASDLYYKAIPGCIPRVNCSTSGGSEVHAE
jgi:cytoskeletal protein CcmA (bactofilin family)